MTAKAKKQKKIITIFKGIVLALKTWNWDKVGCLKLIINILTHKISHLKYYLGSFNNWFENLPDSHEDDGQDEGDEGERVRQSSSKLHQDVTVHVERLKPIKWNTCSSIIF